MNFLVLIGIAIPFFLGLIILERYIYKKRGQQFPLLESMASIFLGLSFLVEHKWLVPLVEPVQRLAFSLRIYDFEPNNVWSWVIGFVGVEFFYYWLHRSAHEIRWMWASHSVHHSPETMTFSGAYRLGITGVFSGLFIFFLPLFALGFSPEFIGSVFAINLIYQFFLHTELVPKLGFLELIFNSPSHHRVHHAINDKYLDKNYGGVLIIFDRLFGTFQEEDENETIQYGLLGKKGTLNPIKLLFQEWVAIFQDLRKAKNLNEIFHYSFGKPGWKPEVERSGLDKRPGVIDSEQNVSQVNISSLHSLGERLYGTNSGHRR